MRRTLGSLVMAVLLAASAVASCSDAPDPLGPGASPLAPSGTRRDAGGAPAAADATPSPGASDPADANASTPPADPAGPTGAGPQQHNLDVINGYRAAKGIGPLVLDAKLDVFAQAGSEQLSEDHAPHAHFMTAAQNGSLQTAGFQGGAAENQGSPTGWNVMSSDPVANERMQIESIMQAMLAEGPGAGDAHGHYTNLMNPGYHRMGVGLVTVSGHLFLTNDFSP